MCGGPVADDDDDDDGSGGEQALVSCQKLIKKDTLTKHGKKSFG